MVKQHVLYTLQDRDYKVIAKHLIVHQKCGTYRGAQQMNRNISKKSTQFLRQPNVFIVESVRIYPTADQKFMDWAGNIIEI